MRNRLRTGLAASGILSLAAAATISLALPAAAAGSTFFVDCSAASNGNGTSAPWNSLAGPNNHVFAPGDTLSFRAGKSCTGTLSPKGNGSAGAPVTVTDYGTGALPVIDGNGASAAFTLTNQDYWTLRNLKLTNPAPTLARRAGLLITADDGKAHTGYDIGQLVIDKVAGQTAKIGTTFNDFVASAGIVTAAPTAGSTLNNVHVHDNQVSNTGGGGIKVRVGSGHTLGSGVLIERNTVDAVGGDGIIASYAESPMIQDNVGSGIGNGTYPFTHGVFAGMWVLGDHNPTMQRNVVYGITHYTNDSTAFDCDFGNTGTCTVQYNYTHDNAGGFFMNCDGCGTIGGALEVVRYNISQNDCRFTNHGGKSAMQFYNNDIYCLNRKFSISLPSTSLVENNIWVGTTDSTLPTGSGITWLWNVFQGVPRPTSNGIIGDPHFVKAGSGGNTLNSVDGYKLTAASPALASAGVVSGNGGADFWGNPVSSTGRPNRGAYNGPGQ